MGGQSPPRDLGQVILASAILGNTLDWISIALIGGLAAHGMVKIAPLLVSVLGTLAFLAVSFTVGRRWVARLIRWTNDHLVSEMPVELLRRRAARATGKPPLAIGMNARGSAEIIVASIGLAVGVLNKDFFTLIVLMTLITPPLLCWALGACRRARGAQAHLPGGHGGTRVRAGIRAGARGREWQCRWPVGGAFERLVHRHAPTHHDRARPPGT